MTSRRRFYDRLTKHFALLALHLSHVLSSALQQRLTSQKACVVFEQALRTSAGRHGRAVGRTWRSSRSRFNCATANVMSNKRTRPGGLQANRAVKTAWMLSSPLPPRIYYSTLSFEHPQIPLAFLSLSSSIARAVALLPAVVKALPIPSLHPPWQLPSWDTRTTAFPSFTQPAFQPETSLQSW